MSLGSSRRFSALSAAIALLVASVAPWRDLGFATQSGLDAEGGAVTLVLGILVLVALALRASGFTVALIGALSTFVAIGYLSDYPDGDWGLLLALIASFALVVTGLLIGRESAIAPRRELVVVGGIVAALVLLVAAVLLLDDEPVAKDLKPPDLEELEIEP